MRVRIHIHGHVQGVGFRPWIAKEARTRGLAGVVYNVGSSAIVDLEALPHQIDRFVQELLPNPPRPIQVDSYTITPSTPIQQKLFDILDSQVGDEPWPWPKDIAICDECLREFHDPRNRRFGYLFNHCSSCGPRWSILNQFPYDRAHTSMQEFPPCEVCRSEYADPFNRRYHSQNISCKDCGPQVSVPIDGIVDAVCSGMICAVLGVGGYQLWVDATSEDAVRRLRDRKNRPRKPLALMVLPDWVSDLAHVSPAEMLELKSPAAPIVLLQKRHGVGRFNISEQIAPGSPELGLMLPPTALHWALLEKIARPVVATSGNFSGEPICISPVEARENLAQIADTFFDHNRRVVRSLDDSVIRMVGDKALTLRLGRGLAPLHLPPIGRLEGQMVLGAGGDLKAAIAVRTDHGTQLSQHLGDLGSKASRHLYLSTLNDMKGQSSLRLQCDLHPDFLSTAFLQSQCPGVSPLFVQHHFAHALSCWNEHRHLLPALAFTWDGMGWGEDRTAWGGECLELQVPDQMTKQMHFVRRAHFHTFRIPGGDKVIEDPRRSLFGLLHGLKQNDLIEKRYSESERRIFAKMICSEVNAPATSSVGRLFDSIAALLGICRQVSFEGEAALALQVAAQKSPCESHYLGESSGWDWQLWMPKLIEDFLHGAAKEDIARRFHNTLIETAVREAKAAGIPTISLSGGSFQNTLLLVGIKESLTGLGFQVYFPQRVPINDGGLAAGQVIACV